MIVTQGKSKSILITKLTNLIRIVKTGCADIKVCQFNDRHVRSRFLWFKNCSEGAIPSHGITGAFIADLKSET